MTKTQLNRTKYKTKQKNKLILKNGKQKNQNNIKVQKKTRLNKKKLTNKNQNKTRGNKKNQNKAKKYIYNTKGYLQKFIKGKYIYTQNKTKLNMQNKTNSNILVFKQDKIG